LADYRDRYQAIRAAGADVVAISVDKPSRSEELRRELDLPFPILSDADRYVVREWGIFNQRERGGIAKPAVFIIDADRRVLFRSVDGVRTRVGADEVIRALQTPGTNAPRAKVGYRPGLGEIIHAIRNNIRSIQNL
jgi:peroxiredoxin